MADNVNVKDASAATIVAATDELADLSQSPKVTLLRGDATVAAISPSTAYAEDAAATSGDFLTPAGAVRRDTATSGASDGDYVTINVDASGRLWVNPQGDVAHDGADTGNPLKVGGKAIAHGTNPTAVAAGDRTDYYANRAGIPFHIGGHPNVIARSNLITDSDGAQTDASLAGSIGSGTKVVITRMSIYCDHANTGDTAVKVGFGASTLASSALAGTNAIIFEGSFDGGAGITIGDGSGIIAIGGDGEELRLTCADPTGGNLTISYSYYTIES